MKYFLIFLFIGCLCESYAQQNKIDSLLAALKNPEKEDTSKINTLNLLAYEYVSVNNYDKAMQCAQQALQIPEPGVSGQAGNAGKINYQKGIANSYNVIGNIYRFKGNYDRALDNYLKSLKIRQSIADKVNIADSYNNIGLVNNFEENYETAIEDYLKALKIYEELKDIRGIARSYHNIGLLSVCEQNNEKAMEYFFKALKIWNGIPDKTRRDKQGIASCYHNMANAYCNDGDYKNGKENYLRAIKIWEEIEDKPELKTAYRNLGIICGRLENFDMALEYLHKSLKIAEEFENKGEQAVIYVQIGTVYSAQKNYDKALKIQLQALKIREETGDSNQTADSYYNIAQVYLEQNKLEEALRYLNQALHIFNEVANLPAVQSCYLSLSKLFEKKRDFKRALNYHTLYTNIKDSLRTGESTKRIAGMTAKYETERRDKEIKSLTENAEILGLQNTKSRYLINGLIGSFILLLVIALLIMRQHKQKSKQIAVELQQKLLRSQMNPHFIFNSLNAIQSFIYKNEIKESAKYLSGFAKLMRMILENSREEYVSLDREINTLEHYLTLQKLRFDNKFDFTLEVDPKINRDLLGIPPMFAQPFIENAIEHGIMHKNSKGKINIKFNLQRDMIVLEIKDDGVGRDKSAEMKDPGKEHRSLATTITQERIVILNKKNKKKINLKISDLNKDELSGTKVIFTIPYKKLAVAGHVLKAA